MANKASIHDEMVTYAVLKKITSAEEGMDIDTLLENLHGDKYASVVSQQEDPKEYLADVLESLEHGGTVQKDVRDEEDFYSVPDNAQHSVEVYFEQVEHCKPTKTFLGNLTLHSSDEGTILRDVPYEPSQTKLIPASKERTQNVLGTKDPRREELGL